MKTKTKIGILLVSMLLLSLSTLQVAHAASGDSTGTAHVLSAEPTLSNPQLLTTSNSDVNNTGLTVNTEYWCNFTIGHGSELSYLKNVTIRIWDSALTGESDTDFIYQHYSYTWVESTDTWSCLNGAGYIVEANCSDPGAASSLTTYEFRLAFKLSKIARYAATPNWKITIFVWDDATPNNEDVDRSLVFGANFYSEITITDTTHEWTGLLPSTSVNVTVDSAPVDFTVLANGQYDIQCMGNASLTKGSDTIPLSNLRFYGADTLTSSSIMTTEYQNVGALQDQAACTTETPVNHGIYLWLTVPDGTPPGDYVYKLSTQIISG